MITNKNSKTVKYDLQCNSESHDHFWNVYCFMRDPTLDQTARRNHENDYSLQLVHLVCDCFSV